MPLLRLPGRAKTHAEETRRLLVIASGHSVGLRQLGAHCRVTPVCLQRAPCIDESGLDQRMARFCLTQGLRFRVREHGALPAVGIEAIEGTQKRIAANIAAETLDISLFGQSLESHREGLQVAD